MELVSEGDPQGRPSPGRTAALLAEIAAILRIDPVIFFDGEIQERVGQHLAADELAELLALFRSIDAPNLCEAAHDLIRTLKRGGNSDT
ncbi:hypothetical protein [Methylobacterium gregans]|uniref:Uncharacterized protein n=1 Tax=Methylobacterium gregans TaxID=374424 RepID=A0AA37MC11_9HYPH|nr:hypothetical protein [Methylobacterium gregans]MDQ0523001.1 hypothetical protein [Methylobacterium gregans]GJD80715.1 hypothetical protein NBEOAGPD_3958 [Methylobacterium gregans]